VVREEYHGNGVSGPDEAPFIVCFSKQQINLAAIEEERDARTPVTAIVSPWAVVHHDICDLGADEVGPAAHAADSSQWGVSGDLVGGEDIETATRMS
jgi:hypothetical protein